MKTVESGLIALMKWIMENSVKSMAKPALGCGNGGLDWKIVRPMIEQHLGKLDMAIWVYEPGIRAS